MRQAVKRVWNQRVTLATAISDAKAMTLDEGQSVAEELALMEAQLEKLTQEFEERQKNTVKEHYSVEAERLNMGEFILTRILNSDVESRTIWILGKFRRDPTEN